MPGNEGEWNRVWLASDICMTADTDAVLSALRNIFPMTHACSHVKCANVKLLSSLARSMRFCVGVGRVSSIVEELDDEMDW